MSNLDFDFLLPLPDSPKEAAMDPYAFDSYQPVKSPGKSPKGAGDPHGFEEGSYAAGGGYQAAASRAAR